MEPEPYSQEQKMPFSKQSALDQVQETIQSLPSQMRYVKVYPYAKSKSPEEAPYILTYEDKDQLFVSDLTNKYAQEIKRPKETIFFKLKGGYMLDKHRTIPDIKKQLRLDSLDGLELYLDKLIFSLDECQIETLLLGEQSHNKKAAEVQFVLPDIKYSIYLPLQGGKIGEEKMFSFFQSVVAGLSTEIKRIFRRQINHKNIALSYLQNGKQILNQKIRFWKLYKNDKVKVSFKNKLVLPPPPRENNSILIIQGEGIKENKNHYDDIKDKKLKDLLNQIDPRPKWNDYGLKIGDLVLKPDEKFEKAHYLMKNSNQNWKTFCGVLINEAQMFEAEQNKIKKIGKFDLEKVVDKKKTNLDLRDTCNKMIMERAKNATHVYFKGKIENIKPIFIYTSQLQVRPSLPGSSAALYRNLNVFLRNQSFGQTTQYQYKQIWEYLFTNNLLQQLKNIQPVRNSVLYRGVNFLPSHKVGQKILYKQFNSTTPILKKAKQFAGMALFKITKSYSGKPIKEFSYYQVEDEVLFQPYCQFKVNKISTTVNEMIMGMTIPLIQIEEIEKAPMPDSTALFLLWVDDKTKEVNDMWGSLTSIKKNSIMVPLLSTEELSNWLNDQKALLLDKTAEFVMVTNMTRMEKGVKNEEAGVYAIKQFKKFRPDGRIFVYIGWVEGTIQKLKKHNLITSNNNNNIEVSNSSDDLSKFLKVYGGLS